MSEVLRRHSELDGVVQSLELGRGRAVSAVVWASVEQALDMCGSGEKYLHDALETDEPFGNPREGEVWKNGLRQLRLNVVDGEEPVLELISGVEVGLAGVEGLCKGGVTGHEEEVAGKHPYEHKSKTPTGMSLMLVVDVPEGVPEELIGAWLKHRDGRFELTRFFWNKENGYYNAGHYRLGVGRLVAALKSRWSEKGGFDDVDLDRFEQIVMGRARMAGEYLEEARDERVRLDSVIGDTDVESLRESDYLLPTKDRLGELMRKLDMKQLGFEGVGPVFDWELDELVEEIGNLRLYMGENRFVEDVLKRRLAVLNEIEKAVTVSLYDWIPVGSSWYELSALYYMLHTEELEELFVGELVESEYDLAGGVDGVWVDCDVWTGERITYELELLRKRGWVGATESNKKQYGGWASSVLEGMWVVREVLQSDSKVLSSEDEAAMWRMMEALSGALSKRLNQYWFFREQWLEVVYKSRESLLVVLEEESDQMRAQELMDRLAVNWYMQKPLLLVEYLASLGDRVEWGDDLSDALRSGARA